MSTGQSVITQWDWGFNTLRGGIDSGDVRFIVPKVFGLYIDWRISDPAMGTYPPRVQGDLGVGPSGNTQSAMAPRAPSNQK